MIVTIITVVLALSFLIFIHELGHFLAAKKVGVHVLEFSIGFPPKIFSRVVGKTEYLISLIPIGGYVRLKGQGIDDEDPSDPENYASKPILHRLFILVSGPMMNLLVTLVFMPLVFFIGYDIPAFLNEAPEIGYVEPGSKAELLDIRKGDLILAVNDTKVKTWKEAQTRLSGSESDITTITLRRGETVSNRLINSKSLSEEAGIGWRARITTVIGSISPESAAAESAIETGDRILEIDSIKTDDWSQISPLVQNSKGEPIRIVIDRNGQKQVHMISPNWNESHQYWVLGVGSKTIHVSENLKNSLILGTKRVYLLTTRTFEFLFRLITGKEDSDSVGGPIMIAKLMGQAVQTSISSFLTLIAFISLQFAIFNLLPIPALDGGHIFFLLIEKIKGKTLSKNLRLSFQKIGFSLLMLLILYISIQDGLRLFNG
jgi:regulator of sigma E protease